MRVLFNALASIITSAQSVQQIFHFDAYGNLLNMSAASAISNYLYSGESFDAKTQLQYLRARFYDPTSGRFLGLDPFSGDSSDPQSLHKYAYVHGDPILGVDPTGLLSITASLSGFYIRLASFARTLLPTFFVVNVARTFVLRAIGGTIVSLGVDFYAQHYLPSLIRELENLANVISPLHRDLSKLIHEQALVTSEIHFSLSRNNVSRPFFIAQLGPLVNIPVLAINIRQMLTGSVRAIEVVNKPLERVFKRQVQIEWNYQALAIAFARGPFDNSFDPAGYVRTVADCVELIKRGNQNDIRRAIGLMGNLVSQLREFARVTITPIN